MPPQSIHLAYPPPPQYSAPIASAVAPIVSSKTYEGPIGQAVVVPASSGLLSLGNGSPLTFKRAVVVTPPPLSAGSLTAPAGADGSFTFTPAPGVVGPVSFDFKAVSSDGTTESQVATAVINIGAVPPLACVQLPACLTGS